jgi:hypothetical protein
VPILSPMDHEYRTGATIRMGNANSGNNIRKSISAPEGKNLRVLQLVDFHGDGLLPASDPLKNMPPDQIWVGNHSSGVLIGYLPRDLEEARHLRDSRVADVPAQAEDKLTPIGITITVQKLSTTKHALTHRVQLVENTISLLVEKIRTYEQSEVRSYNTHTITTPYSRAYLRHTRVKGPESAPAYNVIPGTAGGGCRKTSNSRGHLQ